MAYTAVDIVNLQDCVNSLKELGEQIVCLHNEYALTLVRFESFIDRYKDVPDEQEDLPL